MIREARIILPDTPECLHANTWLVKQLINAFGGCTQSDGFGHWVTQTAGFGHWADDQLKVIAEPVQIYDVAMLDNSSDWHTLRVFAQTACIMAKQNCVYVRSAAGEVFFVKGE